MGGDGGVIASNRRYMRGAGTADHTADSKRRYANGLSSSGKDADAERDNALQSMTRCALAGTKLDFRPSDRTVGGGGTVAGVDGSIVACPYGRLYGREAAVESLLQRRRKENGVGDDGGRDIGEHVRGLKDLHPVRFQVVRGGGAFNSGGEGDYVPVCPVTGLELNGMSAAYVIVPKKAKKNKEKQTMAAKEEEISEEDRLRQPNVLSDRAMKEMGADALRDEFGPFEAEDMIRLAPPTAGGVLDEIKAKLARRREEERLAKKTAKKDENMRKKGHSSRNRTIEGKEASLTMAQEGPPSKKRIIPAENIELATAAGGQKRGSVASAARTRVASAVASNAVLSSLFTSKKDPSSISEKEKKDNLFVR